MPQYPRTQPDVTAQVEAMLAGFTNHPQDFPHADIAALQQAHDEFMLASADFLSSSSQANLAAVRKLEKFRDLQAAMKRQIKMAQADCSDNPEKLGEICWGPKSQPTPVEPPDSPTNLKIIAQETSTIFLSWNKPARREGNPVRIYIIERQQPNGGSPNWHIAGNSYNDEAILKNQPTGVKLEYRVKASNSSGESMPTNTATVVL